MKLTVDDELLEICNEIVAMNKSIEEWAEIESSDMFQSESYSGGFDGTEQEFTFSYFKGPDEYWFQISLDTVKSIVAKRLTEVEIRIAE